MPRSNSFFKTPSNCLHKRSGNAYVTLGGREVWLGSHGSPESRDAYDRALAEWLAARRHRCAITVRAAAAPIGLTVHGRRVVPGTREGLLRVTHTDRPGGPALGELGNFWDVLKLLRRLYGPTPAGAFGPQAR